MPDLLSAQGGGGGSSGGASSLVCSAFNGGAATYNLSTIGTIDWWAIGGAGFSPNTPLTSQAVAYSSGTHCKRTGGLWLRSGFAQFVANGISLTNLTQTSSQTITSDANDSTWTAYNSTSGIGLHTPGSLANVGWGFYYNLWVPGDGVTRTLRIFGNQFQCDVRVTGKLQDGTTDSAVTLSANGSNAYWDVTWSTTKAQLLTVTVLVDTNIATNSNMKIQALAVF